MTGMEKKIIEYISVGLKDDEIAKKLHYSVPVIKGHIDNILEKMSLNTHVQISIYRKSGGDIVNPQFNRQNKLDKKNKLIKTKKRVNAVKNLK
jgi:DNA-binding CsgD family transcriptional regulator